MTQCEAGYWSRSRCQNVTNLAEPCCSPVAFVHSHPLTEEALCHGKAAALPEDTVHSTQEPALQRRRSALGGLAREMRLVRNRNACEVGLCSDTLALMCKATTGSWTEMAAPWTAANYEGKRPCQDHLSCQNSGRQQAIFLISIYSVDLAKRRENEKLSTPLPS